jgi:2-iminobutanoate/2-iminopropanoate deaminase
MSPIEYLSTPYSYSSAVATGDFVFLGLHRGFGDGFGAQLDSAFSNLQKTLATLT